MRQYSLENLAVGKLEYGSGASAIPFDGITRYVRITDIDDDGNLSTDSVSPNIVEGKYILNDGDILFARTGATVGKTYQYHNSDGRCQYAGYLIRLIPNKEIVRPDYIWFFTKSPQYWRFINCSMKIVAQPNINAKQYGNLKLQVPTLEEQDIVISRLTKLLEIIKRRKEQIRLYDKLIKARFVEMFGDPKSNPQCFEKRELRSTCTVITGNTPSRAISDYYGNYIEWIKTDNIVAGKTTPSKAAEYLSERGMSVGRTVDRGAILMACIAGSIASIGRVCITDRKVAFNQQINAIVPNDYDVRFLYVLLQISKDYLVEEINMALKGILSKSKLEDKEFYVPPIEQQMQFAEFVEQVDKSKSVVQKSLDEAQLLFDSLMQEYFG